MHLTMVGPVGGLKVDVCTYEAANSISSNVDQSVSKLPCLVTGGRWVEYLLFKNTELFF